MRLSDLYYYFIAFAMMAGVQIASALKLNIDQKPNGRIYIGFRSPGSFNSSSKTEDSVLVEKATTNFMSTSTTLADED